MAGTVIAIVSSPIFGQKDTIFQVLTDLICYISGPITAVFLFGVFWKAATAKAAYLAMTLGNVVGVVVFFLEMFKDKTPGDSTADGIALWIGTSTSPACASIR